MDSLTVIPDVTDSERCQADALSRQLEVAFGRVFELWRRDGDLWHPLGTVARHPPDPRLDPRCPEVHGVDDRRRELIIPIRRPAGRWLARSLFESRDATLLHRLAQSFLRELEGQAEIVGLRFESEQLALQVTRDFEQLAFLQDVADRLRLSTGSENFREVAEVLLPHVLPSVRAEQISLVLNDSTGERQGSAGSGPETVFTVGKQVLPAEAVWELVNRFGKDASRQPFVCSRLEDSRFSDVRQLVLIGVASGARRLGWLVAINRDPRTHHPNDLECADQEASELEFGTEEASLLSSAASVLATYASNLELLRQKENLLVDVVRALVRAVEAKDEYTRGHSERVALYARRLAQQLELDSEDCHRIYLTGLLHDVGKIGVPDDVLQKPGKLTDDEFELVKRHPGAGGAIMGDLRLLDYVLPGILHHHERYDGRGYPAGLRGDQIPLPARILAVADAFDAMTSDRSYRRGMPVEKALSILLEGGDVQWDKRIVDTFELVLPDILLIRDSYQETSGGTGQDQLGDSKPRPDGGAGASVRGPERTGFTFIELVAVLLIMGILSAAAVPKIADSLQRQKVRQAALRVKADLELARDQARTTSSSRSVLFDVAAGQYHLPGIADLDHPGKVYLVNLPGSDSGATIGAAEFADANDADILFDGWGYPDSGGSVVVVSNGTQRRVAIDGDSGLVTIQDD